MQSRVFTRSGQDMFVRLSGDYNPLHTDPFWLVGLSFANKFAMVSKAVAGINIFSPRLPKLATDQTVSLIGQRIDSPDVIMLNQLNQFQMLGRNNIYA